MAEREQVHREFGRKMAARFQNVADCYHRHGLPADVISAVFFGAAVESLLAGGKAAERHRRRGA